MHLRAFGHGLEDTKFHPCTSPVERRGSKRCFAIGGARVSAFRARVKKMQPMPRSFSYHRGNHVQRRPGFGPRGAQEQMMLRSATLNFDRAVLALTSASLCSRASRQSVLNGRYKVLFGTDSANVILVQG